MNKIQLTIAMCGMGFLASAARADTVTEGYQLQQVLVMSRHNLRAPLANNGSVLEQSTTNKWPEWDVPGGQLTTKGGVLEVYMGHYMREWLAQKGMVAAGECPPANSIYVYANSLQPTANCRHRAVLYHRCFPGLRCACPSSGENGHHGPDL